MPNLRRHGALSRETGPPRCTYAGAHPPARVGAAVQERTSAEERMGESRFRGHTYSLWLEGRLDLLPLQFVPVDVAEERVLLDVPLPFGAASEALGRVLGHQLGERKRRNSHSVSNCSDAPGSLHHAATAPGHPSPRPAPQEGLPSPLPGVAAQGRGQREKLELQA